MQSECLTMLSLWHLLDILHSVAETYQKQPTKKETKI